MIPANAFTVIPVFGTFLYLEDAQYTPLTQTILGGIALNDTSHGRLYQPWTVTYNGSSITINPNISPPVFTLVTPDVNSVSLAFDQNMSIVLAWTTSLGANLYYFDTILSTYTTRYFNGITSCRVCVDDPRDFYAGSSDVIFGYTLANNLCYRVQRDRYNIEYIIAPTTKKLARMGPTAQNRLQFETI